MKTALEQFEAYVRNGHYRQLKQIEQMQIEFKAYLEDLLREEDGRRFELANGRYVAKFVRKEQFKLNTAAIIDELSCYIRTPLLFELELLKFKPDKETLSLVEPFKKEIDWYIKPTFNKLGKTFTGISKGYYDSYPALLLDYEYYLYEQREEHLKRLQSEYKSITTNLNKELVQSCKFELCTLSKLAKAPEYDVLAILEQFGDEFVLEHCTVSSTALKQLIEAEIIPGSVLKTNRELIDIRVEFTFMSMANEQIQCDMMDRQKEMFRQKLQGVLT